MSEYQYYEFKAIDNALSEKQKEKLHQLSSRAEVSSHHAKFVYNYGDFRGSVKELMRTSFDAMIYLANWGSRRLIFRLPCHLVDSSEWRAFFISDAIEKTICSDNQNFILDFNFHDEEFDSWVEGEGWLDDLHNLRNDIINGDFRVLYLAWLKATQQLIAEEELEDDVFEPPIPVGLGQLNPALKQFIRYIELDEQLVKAAAKNCSKLTERTRDTESLISQLSSQEQQQFLVRLSNNEINLSACLNRHLDQLLTPVTPSKIEPRTFQQLTEMAKTATIKANKKQQEKAKKARENELKLMLGQKQIIWQMVDNFIEQKNASAYDKALKHLINLRDLAEFEHKGDEFNQRLLSLKETYSKRRALLERINRVDLV